MILKGILKKIYCRLSIGVDSLLDEIINAWVCISKNKWSNHGIHDAENYFENGQHTNFWVFQNHFVLGYDECE